MRLVISDEPRKDYRALVWDTFFLKRSRGTALRNHFPNLYAFDPSFWYAYAFIGEELAAGVCIREKVHGVESVVVGALGLVCVSEVFRGRKISHQILQRVISVAKDRGCVALTLWTGIPDLYEKLGFYVNDDSLFGSIKLPAHRENIAVAQVDSVELLQGLPPFATSGRVVRHRDGTVTLLNTPAGEAIVSWSGCEKAICDLLLGLGHRSLFLNAREGDSLMLELEASGFEIHMKGNNIQMWHELGAKSVVNRMWCEITNYRVLDRI